MKNITLSVAAFLLFTTSAIAQHKDAVLGSTPATTATNTDKFEDFGKFDKSEHNFGNLPEGPQAKTDFEVTNTSKTEPLIISNVQASCGCTVPSWSKEAIAPGKTGIISAIYNTQGRPGNIYKTLTVTTNHGTTVLKLTGNVEKAPISSLPANDASILKH